MNETISELRNAWQRIQNELGKNIEDRHFFDVYLSESYIHSIENGLMTFTAKIRKNVVFEKYEKLISEMYKA